MTRLAVTLTQHPVGQGGLMSGLLEIPGGRFHWVYDCGSNQKDALTREIGEVAKVGDVDCLFLSHLDSDHVNGIDQLLASVQVREVVLPYLNNVDFFLAAARDASRGTLTGTMLTMLADIPGWFGARGVEQVTFINPDADDDGREGSGPDLPDGDLEGPREGQIRAKWSRRERDAILTPASRQREGRPFVQQLERQASLQLIPSQGPQLDWVFAPYAHRPSGGQMKDFIAALEAAFGKISLNDDFWAKAIGDPRKREELRKCYDVIWSDHNLVSMALFAGPVTAKNWSKHQCKGRISLPRSPFYSEIGWLGTGDMHLDVNVRRARFFKHYDRLFPRVNVFGLPHHGSHLNYDPSLPGSMPNAGQFVAASGPNSYGHPSKLVKQSVHAAGKNFVRVSNREPTVLQWRHSR